MCASSCPTSAIYLNRADQNCLSSCSYQNVSGGAIICESSSDSINCPFFSTTDNVTFSCVKTCPLYYYNRLCYSSCPADHPFATSAGNLSCTLCSSGLYIIANGVAQCISTCTLPLSNTSTIDGVSSIYLC